jgi:hypothetical protein
MKTCSTCFEEKPISAYTKHAPAKDGLCPRCRVCRSVSRKAIREADPEKYRADKRAYYARNIEQERAAKRADYAKNKNNESRIAWGREYRVNNKEARAANHKAWKAANREHANALSAIHRKRNIDAVRAQALAYIARNKEKVLKSNAEYKKSNPHIAAAYQTRRRAKKFNATPRWASNKRMLEFYAESSRLTLETGIAHEVDHIVPLLSGLVCGLHCEANLQVITAFENQSKNNRFWPDMP